MIAVVVIALMILPLIAGPAVFGTWPKPAPRERPADPPVTFGPTGNASRARA